MQWNFDTTRETKPVVRPDVQLLMGNGNPDEHLVNHISEPPPVSTSPIEVSRTTNPMTELDVPPRAPSQPTRLSNGLETHLEEVKSTGESPRSDSPLALKDTNPVPSLDNPKETGAEANGPTNSDSEGDNNEVISERIETRTSSVKEGGIRHMSAMSISEETRVLDEALSRASMSSIDDTPFTESMSLVPQREDPSLYEHVGGNSSSEEEVHPMEITTIAVSGVPVSPHEQHMHNILFLCDL